MHYKEGQLVRKGEPLMDIDPRPYEAQLIKRKATLERDTHCWPSEDGPAALPGRLGQEQDSQADAG